VVLVGQAQPHLGDVNTLRYRIGKIAELTGRDLSTFPDRVDQGIGKVVFVCRHVCFVP